MSPPAPPEKVSRVSASEGYTVWCRFGEKQITSSQSQLGSHVAVRAA